MLRKKFYTFGLKPDGVFAICGGLRSVSTYKYILLTDVSAPSTSFTVLIINSWAIGNSEKSVWGSSNQNGGSNTQKYAYASNTTGAGGSLTIGLGTANGASSSTPFFGLTVTANSTNIGKINKYTFATDAAVTAAGSLMATGGMTGAGASGIGNKTNAIFANINSPINTNKYTYSGDLVTQAANLIYNNASSYSTMSNKDFGLIMGPNSNTLQQLNKYMFASDTVDTGTSLIPPTLYSGGCGNSEYGVIFTQTAGQISNKYIYATNTVVNAGSVPVACNAAMVNGCTGVNV